MPKIETNLDRATRLGLPAAQEFDGARPPMNHCWSCDAVFDNKERLILTLQGEDSIFFCDMFCVAEWLPIAVLRGFDQGVDVGFKRGYTAIEWRSLPPPNG